MIFVDALCMSTLFVSSLLHVIQDDTGLLTRHRLIFKRLSLIAFGYICIRWVFMGYTTMKDYIVISLVFPYLLAEGELFLQRRKNKISALFLEFMTVAYLFVCVIGMVYLL